MVATAERIETNLRELNAANRVRPPVMGNDDDFLESKELAARAQMLIEEHGLAAGQYSIRYLWKRKGGKERGFPKFGMCQLTTGMLGFFGRCDAVIWLAADTLAGKSDKQIEACLFHELLHIGSDEETLEIKLLPHQFAGFFEEIDAYGLHLDQLVVAKEHFDQASFPL